MPTLQYKMNSKIGPLYLVASADGLEGVLFRPQIDSHITNVTALDGTGREIQILSQATRELKEYIEGRRITFEVPLSMKGTVFQQQVWKELARIPYGKTVSYKDIARKIKNPKAVRAVGTANGRNPVAIIVPCHRVIAASGKLGGYGGGLPIKTALLEIEGCRTDQF